MTTISAQTILRSRNSSCPSKVLSTLLLRYPRWIHAELMTHRQFSRNAASSRAIPVEKMIQSVKDDPAVPLFWGKNQKGMQAAEEHNAGVWITPRGYDGKEFLLREAAWLEASDEAIRAAEAFAKAGYHKQLVNRLLEPFMHITVLVSSTEWSNFLALRDHPDAEPHFRLLAQEVRKELDREDNIQVIDPGQMHLPFTKGGTVDWFDTSASTTARIRMSLACCASTSYKTVDGFDMTPERADIIQQKLASGSPKHASPFEHVAYADEYIALGQRWGDPSLHGNFVGFCQYRKLLPGECL